MGLPRVVVSPEMHEGSVPAGDTVPAADRGVPALHPTGQVQEQVTPRKAEPGGDGCGGGGLEIGGRKWKQQQQQPQHKICPDISTPYGGASGDDDDAAATVASNFVPKDAGEGAGPLPFLIIRLEQPLRQHWRRSRGDLDDDVGLVGQAEGRTVSSLPERNEGSRSLKCLRSIASSLLQTLLQSLKIVDS
jgi:hypothetical protein